jgi:hypothetical protein
MATMRTGWDDQVEAEYYRHASADAVYARLSALSREELFTDENLAPLSLDAVRARSEPLVQLGIARFCGNDETLKEIFATGNPALRCAVLANRNVNHGSILRSPLGDSAYDAVLCGGSEQEKEALLTNPSIEAYLVDKVVEHSLPTSALDEEAWRQSIVYIGRNEKFATTLKDYDFNSFTARHDHESPIAKLWELLWTVDSTPRWAGHLADVYARIYFKLPSSHSKPADLVDVLQNRWGTPELRQDKSRAPAILRQVCAKRLCESRLASSELAHLAKHDDPAIRYGYYEGIRLTDSFDIENARDRDGDEGIEALARNRTLYLRSNHELQARVRAAAWQIEGSLDYVPGMLHSMLERFAKEDPQLYGDELLTANEVESQLESTQPAVAAPPDALSASMRKQTDFAWLWPAIAVFLLLVLIFD